MCSKIRLQSLFPGINDHCFKMFRFITENERKIDLNQICYYPTFASNRWLSVRLESIGNLIILVKLAPRCESRY